MASQNFLPIRFLTPIFALALLAESVSTSLAATTLTPVAVSRAKFLQGSNVRIGSFGAPGINLRKALVFYATCYGSGIDASNNAIVVRMASTGKNAHVVVQKGASGGTGATLTGLSTNPYINNSYLVSWSGVFTLITITTDDQGNVQQEITYNTYFFQTSKAGGTSRYFTFPDQNVIDKSFDLNNKGAITLLAGDLSRPDAPQSVFRLQPGNPVALVAVGETAVGLPLGSAFTEFGEPTIADNNYVVFAAKVSDTDSAFDGIWYGRTGDPTPVVVNGQKVPQLGTLSGFSDPAVPSSSGSLIGFAATGDKGSGVVVANVATGALTLIAKTGQTVSGFALSGLQPPAVNNRGQVAFGAKTAGAALTSTDVNRINALFFANPLESPTKIIADGDTVIVKGKSKKVIDLRFAPTRGLNENGYVAFTASFNDRTSGVFIVKP